jgi:hypothetical protein
MTTVDFARGYYTGPPNVRVLVWANESNASPSWRIDGLSNREADERLSISAR